jgi:hypothetical protein
LNLPENVLVERDAAQQLEQRHEHIGVGRVRSDQLGQLRNERDGELVAAFNAQACLLLRKTLIVVAFRRAARGAAAVLV